MDQTRKQAKPAQWQGLKTAATSDSTTTDTVLMYEDMHHHIQKLTQ